MANPARHRPLPTVAGGHTPPPLQENAIRKSWPQSPHRARAKPQARTPLGEPGLEALLDAAIEHALARVARPVARGCDGPGGALDLHARPLSPAFRGWGSASLARGAGRHWPQPGRSARGGLCGCRWRSWGRQAGTLEAAVTRRWPVQPRMRMRPRLRSAHFS